MKNTKKMVTSFNTKDMVSFGSYLLSEKRVKLFRPEVSSNETPSPEEIDKLKERLSNVHHADIENWKELQKEKINIETDCSYSKALEAIKDSFWAIRKYAYGRFVISRYNNDKLVFTELGTGVHHSYIPSFEDQMAEDWVIMYNPEYFKQ